MNDKFFKEMMAELEGQQKISLEYMDEIFKLKCENQRLKNKIKSILKMAQLLEKENTKLSYGELREMVGEIK